MTTHTTATWPNAELRPAKPDTAVDLFAKQYREMSRNHGQHKRPFVITAVCYPDGSATIFSGGPAGKVDK